MGAAESILTTVVGLLMTVTALGLGLYKPVKSMLRRLDEHVAIVARTSATAAMKATGGAVAEVAEQCRVLAVQVDAVATTVTNLTNRLDSHVDTSGRHTS